MNVMQQEPQFPEYDGINYEEVTNCYITASRVGGNGVREILEELDPENIKEDFETVKTTTGVLYNGQKASLALVQDERGIRYPTLETRSYETEFEREELRKEVEQEPQLEEEKGIEISQKEPEKEKDGLSFADQVQEAAEGAPKTTINFGTKTADQYIANGSVLTGETKALVRQRNDEIREFSDDHEDITHAATGIADGMRKCDRVVSLEQQNQRDNGMSR